MIYIIKNYHMKKIILNLFKPNFTEIRISHEL